MDKIAEIPSDSIDCIITSPPYWSLRDYQTGEWIGGIDANCKHDSIRRKTREERGGLSELQKGNQGSFGDEPKWLSKKCPDCDAVYVDEQWGLEPNFHDYLHKLKLLMRELRRVLKPSGTCWINIGDTYGGGTPHSDWSGSDERFDKKRQPQAFARKFIKPYPKSLIGIPERFYIQCLDDIEVDKEGQILQEYRWIGRNKIPWMKGNSMPSSVKDRFTNKWEPIFYFVKQERYYFNLDAVREKPKTEPKKAKVQNSQGLVQKSLFEVSTEEYVDSSPAMPNGQKRLKDRTMEGRESGQTHDNTLGAVPREIPEEFTYKGDGPPGRWRLHYDADGNCFGCGKHWKKHTVNERAKGSMSEASKRTEDIVWCNINGKNPGDFFGGKATLEWMREWQKNELSIHGDNAYHEGGKNPGDFISNQRGTVFYDASKPYAVQEREGLVFYRILPKHENIRQFLSEAKKKAGITLEKLEEQFGTQAPKHWFENNGSFPSVDDWIKLKELLNFSDDYDDIMTIEYVKPAEKTDNPNGPNPGDGIFVNNVPDVFFINPQPFPEAHFATFPFSLPLKMLKCGCPNQVCKKCNKPREPIIEGNFVERPDGDELEEIAHEKGIAPKKNQARNRWKGGDIPVQEKTQTGWTDCGCGAGWKPGVVLDPFFGAGTVGLAAEKLGLDWIGIELSRKYVEMARKRLDKFQNTRLVSLT